MRFVCFWLLLAGSALAQDLRLTPAPGDTVSQTRPQIQVYLEKGDFPPGSQHLWVNDQEVTPFCLRGPNFLNYHPMDALPSGPVRLRFVAGERQQEWSFLCQAASRVSEVRHNAKDQLAEGDVLVVEMRAEPKGKAAFRLDGGPQRPMSEIAPGQYEGRYQVTSQDMFMGAPLDVVYARDTHQEVVRCREKVKMFGSIFRVRIDSPKDGSEVDDTFMVTGHTRPNARISLVPKLGFETTLAPTTNSSAVGGTTGSVEGRADANGNFSIEYGLPLTVPGLGVVIAVFAVDEDGTRSAPAFVRCYFK